MGSHYLGMSLRPFLRALVANSTVGFRVFCHCFPRLVWIGLAPCFLLRLPGWRRVIVPSIAAYLFAGGLAPCGLLLASQLKVRIPSRTPLCVLFLAISKDGAFCRDARVNCNPVRSELSSADLSLARLAFVPKAIPRPRVTREILCCRRVFGEAFVAEFHG